MMKFYDLTCVVSDPWVGESQTGQWATRADAEQAEKDAVELARLAIDHSTSTSEMLKLSKQIIDRYEGGKQ